MFLFPIPTLDCGIGSQSSPVHYLHGCPYQMVHTLNTGPPVPNYFGWVVIVAAIYGIWNHQSYRFGGWVIMLLAGMLIAMGPYLRIDGHVVMLGSTPIHLPAQTIDFLFPLFSITAIHAYRYSAVVCIAIAVLATRGMKKLHPYLDVCNTPRDHLPAPQPYPQHTTEISPSPTLRRLRDMPDAAVFTFPIAKENLHDLSMVLLAQTIHEKPIHEGGIHRRAGFEATQLILETITLLMPYLVDGDLNTRVPWKEKWVFAISLKSAIDTSSSPVETKRPSLLPKSLSETPSLVMTIGHYGIYQNNHKTRSIHIFSFCTPEWYVESASHLRLVPIILMQCSL